MVVLTNTPELFGDEIRIFSCVNFREERVARWVDYWDSTDFDDAVFGSLARMGTDYAADFGVSSAEPEPEVRAACEALRAACT